MLESSYASLMRALGMQEDREESQAPRVDFSGQKSTRGAHNTRRLAVTLPWKPWVGIYNQFCNWSVTSQPKATSPVHEPPQVP